MPLPDSATAKKIAVRASVLRKEGKDRSVALKQAWKEYKEGKLK